MVDRECLQLGTLHFKMQRWLFRSALKTKYNPSRQYEQSTGEQKIHSVKCDTCLNTTCVYGLGRISSRGIFVLFILACVAVTALNVYLLRHTEADSGHILPHPEKNSVKKPGFAVYGRNVDSGYLKHVYLVLERLGFERRNDSDWDVLWAHAYPFRVLYSSLKNLEPHQKVNHFPGSGYITQKVDLATSGIPYIPVAFRIPSDVDKLFEYAKINPESLFVQKSNDHRGVRITKANDLNLKAEGTFVQEYVSKPLLVDGHKFDIGVYTIQTSIDPLRVYIYNGDMILRFCPEKYHPFDPDVLDKYVVGDDYLPTWEVPSLQKYYVDLGFSMKESLTAYLKDMGKDPSKIWDQIDDALRRAYLKTEPLMVKSASNYRSKRNFFEMVRFDFVVDEDLNVYIMEANMSPNLSSQHFPPNSMLYEQVLFNTLSLVGVGRKVHGDSLSPRSSSEETMQVTEKNLMVYPAVCARKLCRSSCVSPDCQLCRPCLTAETVDVLKAAYLEHVNRQDCKRIFPPHLTEEDAKRSISLDEYSPENQLMYRWFQGKCLIDRTWC
ncbi:tubulin polyglutamylase TTLL6 isoform X2 [Zootermopsis nevadensis]|uniref:tubulin polyglutamylase TTLL6 isoform X2 n=1 Tax=Zootermopsis nevadensis TaxID=136037 RepID=UPI000B8E787B|nr:tubulin polyglutamylase TTLL6 isoform X2 [Zootermopsis nevadensis]XP_021934389.1 tubulin polyglutamylase TTLL6 isoform X2 [Zootermopsis nevadensis]XP_021934390.1 tubulin polyglutamylase TTLL6 isoform X2 [Zootermopsis nevadensis]XP_021934391.1 tubulin polyglutamylase TTLL6 isoform X2 [Zootermopsis nevadensis]